MFALSKEKEKQALKNSLKSNLSYLFLLFVKLEITYEYPLKFMVLRAYLDLDIYVGGKMKLEEDNSNDGYLMTNNGEKVTTGWSGFNTGIGIVIPLL